MPFIELTPILGVLGVMLTLSIIVERLLMVVDWLIDRLLVAQYSATPVDETKHQVGMAVAQQALEEDKHLREDSPGSASRAEVEPHPERARPESRFEVKPLTIPEASGVYKEFYYQLIGFVVAVIGCKVMNVTAFSFFSSLSPGQQAIRPWEYLLTGIIIGAGSKPVHFLIEFLVSRKIEVSKDEIRSAQATGLREAPGEAATAPNAAVIPASVKPPSSIQGVEDIVGFIYDGGDRPERLEDTHRRDAKVDLIVYHHTTMHSNAGFNELVKVFDQKGWLTGYHCVVFADGTMRVLCRWDRMGNQAAGCNARSVGVAFQGNFEPDPRIPYSNPDGALGILRPTEAQVDAAARVTALWVKLFQVPLEFPKPQSPQEARVPGKKVGIVPHKFIADKACPGGNFPYEEFESRVILYVNRWTNNNDFAVALSEFCKRPMVLDPLQPLAPRGVIV